MSRRHRHLDPNARSCPLSRPSGRRGSAPRSALAAIVAIAILAAPPAARCEDPAQLEAEAMFEAIWRYRAVINQASYRMMLLEVISPADAAKKTGSVKLELHPLKDLQNPSAKLPDRIEITISISGIRHLAIGKDAKVYLGFLRSYKSGNRDLWMPLTLMNMYSSGNSNRVRSQYYFIGLDSADGSLATTIGDLLVGKSGSGDRRFEKMLQHFGSEDRQARRFAAAYAGANGWTFSSDAAHADQPDRFAEVLLGAKDATARHLAAKAYSAIGTDFLPRDKALLEKLFTYNDPETTTPALRDNLRHAAARAETLDPYVRRILAEPGRHQQALSSVLAALGGWDKQALRFRGELEAIVLSSGGPTSRPAGGEPLDRGDRLSALRVLLDAGADSSPQLVSETLCDLPSAVALEYAVDSDLYAVVPQMIDNVRRGRLVFSGAHAAALSLLTRRLPGGEFGEFDAWWSQVVKAGRGEAMVRDGFSDPGERAVAERLITQLGSPVYKRRREARTKLAQMGLAVRPSLKAATESSDAEIAVSAQALIDQAEETFQVCRKTLQTAVNVERQGKQYLPMPEPTPASAPAPATAPADDAGGRQDVAGQPAVGFSIKGAHMVLDYLKNEVSKPKLDSYSLQVGAAKLGSVLSGLPAKIKRANGSEAAIKRAEEAYAAFKKIDPQIRSGKFDGKEITAKLSEISDLVDKAGNS